MTRDEHRTRAEALDATALQLHAEACLAERDRDYRKAMLRRTTAHAKALQARWHRKRAVDMELLNRPLPMFLGTLRHVAPLLIEDINPSPHEYVLGGIRDFNPMRMAKP